MRDFLPADKARRDRVLGVIRSRFSVHGFDEIETPVMEDASRLHSGLGGDNEKLGFAVLKRGLTPESLAAAADAADLSDLGLRFDLTVPLARFYATHRAQLPTVFRSIQIAPVWRAERPQKGRYRQFMQCDIDIIGEPGSLAEIELLTATADTLDALGLDGFTFRINDRRLLTAMLTHFGFTPTEHDAVLITVDKLDKIAEAGVVGELRERGFTAAAIDALEQFFQRPKSDEPMPFGELAIAAALPVGIEPALIAELAALGRAVNESRAGADAAGADAAGADAAGSVAVDVVEFDPFLVRGMGYYTGTIFEIAHPASTSSLGGGGRYDGMIGRFLGTNVAAAGFSIGFERIIDLLETSGENATESVALIHGADVDQAQLLALKTALISQGLRVRLERAPRNPRPLREQLAASGFSRVATVTSQTRTTDDLSFTPLT